MSGDLEEGRFSARLHQISHGSTKEVAWQLNIRCESSNRRTWLVAAGCALQSAARKQVHGHH